MSDQPRNPAKEHVLPEDPNMLVESQRHVIQELTGKIQFLVEYLDSKGLLEDHCFVFPDGDFYKTRDEDPKKS